MRSSVEAERGGYSSAKIGPEAKPAAQAPPFVQGNAGGDASEILISVDRNTNAVIVNAPYRMHQVIQDIITQLDQRRPQVLIEVRVISISHTDGFNLGVELEHNRLDKEKPVLVFSNFGLSEIDAATGERTMNVAGVGLGASIVTGRDLEIIVRALQTEIRAKTLSAPRLLVNRSTRESRQLCPLEIPHQPQRIPGERYGERAAAEGFGRGVQRGDHSGRIRRHRGRPEQ